MVSKKRVPAKHGVSIKKIAKSQPATPPKVKRVKKMKLPKNTSILPPAPVPPVARQKKAHKLSRKVKQAQSQPAFQLDTVGGDNKPASASNNFPGRFLPKDSYQNTFAQKQRNAKASPF